MRLTEYLILEARRNPEQNPRMSAMQQLQKINHDYYGQGVYVRFVDDPKLGLKVNSEWDTPLGLCAYPIKYVIQMSMKVPFGRERQYMIVFTVPRQPGILYTDDDSKIDSFEYNIKNALKAVFKTDKLPEKNTGQIRMSGAADLSIKAGWYYMYHCIKKLMFSQKAWKPEGLMARKVLMSAGYDIGVVDNGLGVIHSSEPYQAVFFNTKDLKLISIIDRRYELAARDRPQREELPTLTNTSDFSGWKT
jgi:hypothetical protein